jgi:hypothetical protein
MNDLGIELVVVAVLLLGAAFAALKVRGSRKAKREMHEKKGDSSSPRTPPRHLP